MARSHSDVMPRGLFNPIHARATLQASAGGPIRRVTDLEFGNVAGHPLPQWRMPRGLLINLMDEPWLTVSGIKSISQQ